MDLIECFFQSDTPVDLLLSDSCELGAERGQLWMNGWLYIRLIFSYDLLLFDIDNHDREFNDFLKDSGQEQGLQYIKS